MDTFGFFIEFFFFRLRTFEAPGTTAYDETDDPNRGTKPVGG